MSQFRYYTNVKSGAYTLQELKDLARNFESPIKFFNEHGNLIGTVYPNGDVVR